MTVEEAGYGGLTWLKPLLSWDLIQHIHQLSPPRSQHCSCAREKHESLRLGSYSWFLKALCNSAPHLSGRIIQWGDLGSSVTVENMRTETSLTLRRTSDLRNPGTCWPRALRSVLRETTLQKKAGKHCPLLAPLILSPVTASSAPFKICETWNIMATQH